MTELEKSAYIQIRRCCANTRAELARHLGISRPTASAVVESLLNLGLIRECGKGKSTGGATPTLLSVTREAFFTLGIDFGYADRMSAVLLDGSGGILAQKEMTFDPSDKAGIVASARQLTGELAGTRKISGTAIALSAVIDEKSRRVLKSVNPLFCDEGFLPLLEEELGCSVFTANRSRAAAISEAFGGAADKEGDFALISLGKSVGSAFWCGGELFCGAGSAAGEIRNLRLTGGERLEEALSREKVSLYSREELLEKCAGALGQIIDIMDFKLLVLSGRFVDFGADFAGLLETKLSQYSVSVKQARFGRFSAARGSAYQLAEVLIRSQK